MIPKVIHYCWFGRNPLPKEAIKCIESWKKFFPDYQIKEWNEENYDFNKCAYVREAYQKKKWAFVSDYARFDILYNYGGIYFDTDVEVINSMKDIVEKGSFIGIESGSPEGLYNECINGNVEEMENLVNPGLGIGAEKGLAIFKEILDGYSTRHFIKENGEFDIYTVCYYVTDFLKKKGVTFKNGLAFSAGMIIYPKDYFCPKDYITGKLYITYNTKSIHHFDATWITPIQKKISNVENKCIDKYGEIIGKKKAKRLTVIYRLINSFQMKGVMGTLYFILGQISKLSFRF